MAKNILLINEMDFSDQVYEGLEALKEALDLNYYLISDLDFEPRRPLFEKRFVHDICDTFKTIQFVKKLGIHFDAVLTKSCELVTPLVALLNREFGNIGNEPKTAFYCRSKYHMRKRLAEAGVPQPKFALCRNRQEVEQAVKKIGIPCVVKPVGGHSSFGTFMVRHDDDAKGVGKEYDHCVQYMRQMSQMELKQMADFTEDELAMMGVEDPVNMVTDYLVEEYMEGPEISVDSLTQDSRVSIMGIAEQVRMVPPYFVEISETMPFSGPDEELKEIEAVIQKTIKALGIKNSPSHTELILTSEGPKVVEIACRIGSDNIHDAIYQTTGYHMLAEVIQIGLGIKRSYPITVKAHYAMEYILPKKEGIFKEIIIPEEVRNDPRVTEFRVDAHAGDLIAPPPKGFDFLGYVGVRGKTREEALSYLKKVLKKITVVYE